jgi:Domain of unknown function (DUF4270)
MAMLFFLAACTSPNDAGRDVLPHDTDIKGYYVDSFGIQMRTILIDTTETYRLSRNLFGNYVDDQFGHLFAETYVQSRITGSNLVFGADTAKLTLDSLVLTIDLVNFYGRYSDPIPLQIFEITDTWPTDSSLDSRASLIADTSHDLANGYRIDFSQLPGFYDQISIRLDDALGNKLLKADRSNLVSNTTFTNFFKGLLIRSKPVSQTISREPGGIFAMDPRSLKSFIKLHYKDTTSVKEVTFAINDNCERFHRISRSNFAGRLLDDVVNEPSLNPTYGCVQAGALANLYVGFPSIKSLDPAIINQATLVLHVDPALDGSIDRFDPPSEIFLLVAADNKRDAVNENVINSTATYNKGTHEYRIPMTNTLQQVLAGDINNNGFIIVPGENGITMNRAVFGGPNHPTLKPRLEVIYTTVPGR